MSVYTPVSDAALAAFLADYDLGRPLRLAGISAGVENSNFFLDTEKGSAVLTIFERLPTHEIPYFLDLTDWLGRADIPCPRPIPARDGRTLKTLCGKPAAIVQRLPGHSVEGRNPTAEEITLLGRLLAHMHRAGQDFPVHRPNPAGPRWWLETVQRLRAHLCRDDVELMQDELREQGRNACQHLPRGVIHADLFPDNVLFSAGRITGVIDFYYACDDLWLYDLAIVANAWCSQPDGPLDSALSQTLWEAYTSERPLVAGEEACWFPLLRAAALRFWLLRLDAQHFPRAGDLTQCKDPAEYQRILLARRAAC
ncbi:homoserine kinase [Acidithiobacillus sulfuriphilus]|uniref:homoserine kinase n=1 Tax=Acidithiobacillus sulfuriphilus TaxID=1867749 RepID=UPI003F60435E